ncbi:homocysteine S-methyltransferase family protein [Chloroflexi bacterium TSY]|nr:homocysteine S-methyltransferase family protein [Chloroflexi bacterium TSY]
MTTLFDRLEANDVILIDGGTGTELEKRNVPMHDNGWSASSTLTHPEVLREVHEEYIQAGADVIITNTFSTSRHVLDECGLVDKFIEINRLAADVAHQARDNVADRPVYVAGSISSTTFFREQPPLAEAEANFNAQADILAEAGVDFFVLEMMRDIDYTNVIVNAVRRTGLPLWLGYSTTIDPDGVVWLYRHDIPLSDALKKQNKEVTPLISIMHTLTEDIDPSLHVVKEYWPGRIGVYAHSGEFIMPNWQFIDMISPEAYADAAENWVAQGVQVIGGCCGIGPEHIRVLKERLNK